MASAIFTKYLGPTTFRAGRIKAYTKVGKSLTHQVVVEYEHGKDQYANHQDAAIKLATKLNWLGHWYGGDNAADGMVFVRHISGATFDVVA